MLSAISSSLFVKLSSSIVSTRPFLPIKREKGNKFIGCSKTLGGHGFGFLVVVKRLRLTQISSRPLQSGITAFYAENLMFLGDKRRFASKNINFSRMRVDLATPSS